MALRARLAAKSPLYTTEEQKELKLNIADQTSSLHARTRADEKKWVYLYFKNKTHADTFVAHAQKTLGQSHFSDKIKVKGTDWYHYTGDRANLYTVPILDKQYDALMAAKRTSAKSRNTSDLFALLTIHSPAHDRFTVSASSNTPVVLPVESKAPVSIPVPTATASVLAPVSTSTVAPTVTNTVSSATPSAVAVSTVPALTSATQEAAGVSSSVLATTTATTTTTAEASTTASSSALFSTSAAAAVENANVTTTPAATRAPSPTGRR